MHDYEKGKVMKTNMNIKVTWSSILPAMLAVVTNNPSNPKIMEEFIRMAKLADKYAEDNDDVT